MGRALGRLAAGALLAAAAVLLSAGVAAVAATPSPPPADVASFAQERAPAIIQGQGGRERSQASGATLVPDFSGTLRPPRLREVFLFSAGFLAGSAAAEPVVSASEWISPIYRDHQPIGTMIIWKPGGGPAEVAHLDGDAELAAALDGMQDDELFIQDERTAEYFALRGGTVRPLNAAARNELATPGPISVLRAVVAERTRAQQQEAQGNGDLGGGSPAAAGGANRPPGGWLPWTAVIAFLGAAFAAAAAAVRRRRRAAGQRVIGAHGTDDDPPPGARPAPVDAAAPA